VQDVEGYIRWLTDPNRQYMDKQQILGYLHYHAYETVGIEGLNQVSSKLQQKPGQFPQVRWRGNLRSWLCDFWIDGNANNRPLNEHIAVLARLAAIHGYSEADIIQKLGAFVRELPACANTCSSRLLNKKYRRIDSVIQSTAKYACHKNEHQVDPDKSTAIFQEVLMRWQGFDPLDKSTWAVPLAKTTVTPNWTDKQRRQLCAYFRKPLFVKDDGLILRFLTGIINLTLVKEKQESGWGKEYLMKWMQVHFPEIKCAKDEKRQRIIKTLKEIGIIKAVFPGRQGMYATHWTLGNLAKQALGMKLDPDISDTTTSHPTVTQCPILTSII